MTTAPETGIPSAPFIVTASPPAADAGRDTARTVQAVT